MNMFLLTCERTTSLLTHFLDGGLSARRRMQVRAHLFFCPSCWAFLDSLRQVPTRLRRLLPPEPPVSSGLESLLKGAMTRIAAGQDPYVLHPDAEWYAKPHLAPLLAAHAGRCPGCATAHPEITPAPGAPGDPLGPSLRSILPPESKWRWHGLGLSGARAITLIQEPTGSLFLIRMPAGKRFPPHIQGGTERSVLLEGTLREAETPIHEGSASTTPTGARHTFTAMDAPCWLLTHVEGDLHFTGWRRLFA